MDKMKTGNLYITNGNCSPHPVHAVLVPQNAVWSSPSAAFRSTIFCGYWSLLRNRKMPVACSFMCQFCF